MNAYCKVKATHHVPGARDHFGLRDPRLVEELPTGSRERDLAEMVQRWQGSTTLDQSERTFRALTAYDYNNRG